LNSKFGGKNGKILDKFFNLSNPQNWGKKSRKFFLAQKLEKIE
jgi:hypothetical protein